MSVFVSVIILILATLIQIFLESSPGLLTLFYHYALGKKNQTAAENLSLSFILGSETFLIFSLFIAYALANLFSVPLNDLPPIITTDIFLWIMAGIFLGESLAVFFFYFRRNDNGKSTALFIPRSLAKSLSNHALKAKSRSDAFLIGFVSRFPEAIFTLPLYLILSIELLQFPSLARTLIFYSFIFLSTLPLFFIVFLFRLGQNLADIERFRVKSKLAVRLILSISFLLLALTLITFKVFIYG
ncbi:MAG: hypothetical protein Q4A79_00355 [Candidatus Saccharibacteria bacterium]|nr:hypothetical protein [Candidatus Saccharibacteria bacterium]